MILNKKFGLVQISLRLNNKSTINYEIKNNFNVNGSSSNAIY